VEEINSGERSSLKSIVIQEIKQYIIEQGLKAGDKFPTERKLTEMYGVSRSVIREALSYLENTGVIRTRQGQGAFLNMTNMGHLLENFFFLWKINGGNIAEIQSLRLIFETAAIDEMSNDFKAESLCSLKSAIRRAEDAETAEAYRDADMNFHVALLEATRNNLFIQMSHVVTEYFFASPDIDLTISEYQQVTAEHRAIVKAIEIGEIEEAKMLLTRHMQNIKS
jgi:GntR family transcriptional repressor for pyruvate dehydrogenase complex